MASSGLNRNSSLFDLDWLMASNPPESTEPAEMPEYKELAGIRSVVDHMVGDLPSVSAN